MVRSSETSTASSQYVTCGIRAPFQLHDERLFQMADSHVAEVEIEERGA